MPTQGIPLSPTTGQAVLIDSVQTLAAGAQATASTRMDSQGRTMLTLGIPAGQQGAPGQATTGSPGSTPAITGGTVTTLPAGSPPTATIRQAGASSYAIDVGLPVGAKGADGVGSPGATGPAPTLTGGTVTTLSAGAQATATLRSTGVSSYALDLGLPVGPAGAAPTLATGNVTTVAAGGSATAAVRSTGGSAYAVDLGIPRGADGSPGANGSVNMAAPATASPTLGTATLLSASRPALFTAIPTATGALVSGSCVIDVAPASSGPWTTEARVGLGVGVGGLLASPHVGPVAVPAGWYVRVTVSGLSLASLSSITTLL